MTHIVTILGARPQFVKAAAVSRVLRGSTIRETIVHTGQHYDHNMSQVFFDELGIPKPDYNLQVSGGGHGAMTGRMLQAIEDILVDTKPDQLLIYGDTNSTLAGALAAVKLHIPIAHVEAGLRSFNIRMPEEVNRILSDRVSSLLLCPTNQAVENLRKEAITEGVHNVGDVMYDVALHYKEKAKIESNALKRLGLEDGNFILATCHRAENTDTTTRLAGILKALAQLSSEQPVVLPLHPRTRKLAHKHGLEKFLASLTVADPLPFLDMVALEQSASVIVTDSGGVQKEAFFYDVPCVTMRDETEWVETLDLGWNTLAGADHEKIVSSVHAFRSTPPTLPETLPYGDGQASEKIMGLLGGS